MREWSLVWGKHIKSTRQFLFFLFFFRRLRREDVGIVNWKVHFEQCYSVTVLNEFYFSFVQTICQSLDILCFERHADHVFSYDFQLKIVIINREKEREKKEWKSSNLIVIGVHVARFWMNLNRIEWLNLGK